MKDSGQYVVNFVHILQLALSSALTFENNIQIKTVNAEK
jgi:hypothetical protein